MTALSANKPLRILIIDDSPSDRMLFREMLKEINEAFIFLSAKDGVSAITQLTADGAEIPDIIFLDFSMPLMNGIETLEAIKKHDHLQPVPVIMYSAGEKDSYEPMARKLGAFECLKKSIEIEKGTEDLKSVIYQVIAQTNHSPL